MAFIRETSVTPGLTFIWLLSLYGVTRRNALGAQALLLSAHVVHRTGRLIIKKAISTNEARRVKTLYSIYSI